MKRAGHLALVVLVVAGALIPVATPAAAQSDDAFVAVDVAASPGPAEPGTNVTVTTTVENVYEDGASYNVQRVVLRDGEGRNSTERDRKHPSTTVSAGNSKTFELFEEFDRTGEFDRYVHLRLLSDDREVVTLVRPVTVTVQQSHPALSLSAADASSDGKADLSLTVANGLPDTVRGLTVDLESDDVDLAEDRHVVSSLEPGNDAVVTVPVRNATAGEKTVTARLSYLTADGESRSVTETLSTTVEDGDGPARIELTGLRVTQDGDDVVVRGSASNVGGSNASSVLVAAVDGDVVGPAQNQATYFVGEVKASDYSSFEVHANLETDTNETVTVPVEVAYDVDGERLTRTVDVEFTPDDRSDAAARQSSSAPVVPVLVGVLVLIVGGLGWRRFR